MAREFDIRTTVRNLETAGLKREAAEAVAGAIRAAQGERVTKSDLAVLEPRLQVILWRALLLQGIAIIGAVVVLVKFIP